MEHLTSWSYNPRIAETILVWAVPISLAATIGIINYFLFLRVLRCFSSPGLLLSVTGLQPAGLPHSEIYGSKVMCTSPQLIAAYHVLHRLCKPRHPPFALNYFLNTITLYVHTNMSKNSFDPHNEL